MITSLLTTFIHTNPLQTYKGVNKSQRGKNSYLLTYSLKTLYILEVHYEFFINEEQHEEVKYGFIARRA